MLTDSFNIADMYKSITRSFFDAIEMPTHERITMLTELATAINDLIVEITPAQTNEILQDNDVNDGERSTAE